MRCPKDNMLMTQLSIHRYECPLCGYKVDTKQEYQLRKILENAEKEKENGKR